jgi:molybdopterin synthase sulfur carrier subunit
MIKVMFFAALREQLNCESLTLNVSSFEDETITIATIKLALIQQHNEWQNTLENTSLLSAVNHNMVNSEYQVNAGDEVAFFPPVTGG